MTETSDSIENSTGKAVNNPAEPDPEIAPEPNALNNVPDSEENDKPIADINSQKLNRILTMKVPVIVKVAEKKAPLADVLKLQLGSMIYFEKDVYQHIELMINNSTIGLGQPVKIGENFGLRITQIGDVTETIKSLGALQQDR